MMGKYKVGDKVKFKNAAAHERWPDMYPAVGTVGVIAEVNKAGEWVQWPEGSTSYNDRWRAAVCDLEPA